MSVRVIVCGSRGWTDRQRIQDVLADVAEELGTCDLLIVHGAARGADRIAADEAGKHGFLVEPHRADWNGYTREDFERFGHKGAGRKRKRIIDRHEGHDRPGGSGWHPSPRRRKARCRCGGVPVTPPKASALSPAGSAEP